MKNKKGLLKVTALAVAGCLFTLSMHVNAFAEEAVGEEDSTITKEEQNDFEILRWEIGNMGMDGEIQTEDSEADSYGIMTYTSYYDIPGTWIQEPDGRWWYRHTDGGYAQNAWERINNRWYYFDSQGYMFVGWLNLDGTWYYLDESGAMQTGWIWSNGKYYYCCESGEMLTGWVCTNNKWYYCDEINGDWIDNTGTQMVQEALKYVGNPYVYGGNSLVTGTDCSGYVKLISSQFGIITPRTSADQYAGSRLINEAGLQPGDLVFYYNGSRVSHVAFYVGKINYNGVLYTRGIVHAYNPKDKICVKLITHPGRPYGYGTYWR